MTYDKMGFRYILDTETTGLEVNQGHRIIEVGVIELKGRRLTGRVFHAYVNPQRAIDAEAQRVHGISLAMLKKAPLFADIAQELIDFVSGGEIIAHNAPFDMGFLDMEFKKLGVRGGLSSEVEVTDTLEMARMKHPGQRNSLDALCKRYGIDNSARDLHGALLDCEILADVFLIMTGGQKDLLDELGSSKQKNNTDFKRVNVISHALAERVPVITATDQALLLHQEFCEKFNIAAF